jgi:hypothetical protein
MRFIPFYIFLLLSPLSLSAQSVEQQFPTPVRNSEISGSIRSRDLGDSRLTTYYYTFDGGQGDLFLNVVTSNLNADIDLFVEQGLRPLTKIVVYADRGDTETGRVIYLRKREKLLLRVQGRTPNDEAGTFRFKFAGGFIAASDDIPDAPELPKAEVTDERARTVTSTGEVVERNDPDRVDEEREAVVRTETPRETVVKTERSRETPPRTERPGVVVTTRERRAAASTGDPMANFTLVIVFKDGSTTERPMTEVSKFQVDKGVLTVSPKNGNPVKYSMADVVRVGIE